MRGLGYIQALEVAQQESLSLTIRQRFQRRIQRRHGLIEFQPRDRRQIIARGLRDRIGVLIFLVAAERHPRHHPPAHRAPALHVADAVFQDSVEERLPFLLGPIRIGTGKLQHRILHRIQRIVLMPQAGLRDLVSL